MQGAGCKVQGAGCGAEGLGLRFESVGFRAEPGDANAKAADASMTYSSPPPIIGVDRLRVAWQNEFLSITWGSA